MPKITPRLHLYNNTPPKEVNPPASRSLWLFLRCCCCAAFPPAPSGPPLMLLALGGRLMRALGSILMQDTSMLDSLGAWGGAQGHTAQHSTPRHSVGMRESRRRQFACMHARTCASTAAPVYSADTFMSLMDRAGRPIFCTSTQAGQGRQASQQLDTSAVCPPATRRRCCCCCRRNLSWLLPAACRGAWPLHGVCLPPWLWWSAAGGAVPPCAATGAAGRQD